MFNVEARNEITTSSCKPTHTLYNYNIRSELFARHYFVVSANNLLHTILEEYLSANN